ncbi:hypothetical protein [Candidatus Chloroploca asiatica]|nr:hypothetical protein [Candidatus Chloroploca asiatica]
MNTPNDNMRYEIRFKGHLGQNTLIWFEGFTVAYSPAGETILCGPLVDQAALDGMLQRICDLGLSLTLFRQLDE